VLYIEELIGPDTVNTMPPQTLTAFNDHGVLEPRLERHLDRAQALFDRLPQLGIPLDALIAQLEQEGVAAFSKSFDALLEALENKRRELVA
jgi:transaldolase